MASIVKRGKSYSVVYYQGTGKKRQQVWESGLSYSTAKSRKTQTEHLNKRFKEILTRRYGKHSFASEREKLAGKMDEFLDGKGISEPQKNEKDEAGSAEQVLQQIMKSNPELLIEFARSVQNANKK